MVHRGERVKKGFMQFGFLFKKLAKESKTNGSFWNHFLSKFTFVYQNEETMALLKYTEIFMYEINCGRSINLSGSFIGVYMREQWICTKRLATLQMCWHEKRKPGSVGADACKKETQALLLWY